MRLRFCRIRAKAKGINNIFKRVFAESLCIRFLRNDCKIKTFKELQRKRIGKYRRKNSRLGDSFSETEGYKKAEVTLGGLSTDELSSKTMESKRVEGLYFIGEVVDVTGWLGGYNFQWAWSSGFAAGQFV